MTRTILCAAALMLAPAIASAQGCNYDRIQEQTAQSCADGKVFDQAAGTCVDQLTG